MEDKVEEVKKLAKENPKSKKKGGGIGGAFLTAVFSVCVMGAVACGVFFATVRGEEQVMVPDVMGKDLASALLEMQEKELYPRLQLRFTEDDDAGIILSQSPEAGAIVKAGRRISLVVSRGAIVDHVENYVGEMYDDVKLRLQSMFSGATKPLVVLSEPSYKADKTPAGTIIAQNPAEGTPISSPINVKLIVSSGSNYETTRVPNLVGLSIEKILVQLSVSKVIFDFNSHIVREGEKPLTATYQQEMKEQFVRNYTHIAVDIAILATSEDKSAGIFSAKLSNYPYPVAMTLESEKDGQKNTLLAFTHTGGNVTIPYNVDHDTSLILSVAGKVVARQYVD